MNKTNKLLFLIIVLIILILGISFFINYRNNKLLILEQSQLSLYEGDKITLNVLNKNENDGLYNWKSSDENVVIVDNFGMIEAIGEGVSIISVYYKGITKQCVVNVNSLDNVILVDNVILSNKNITLKSGESVKLEYNIEPSNANNQLVSWYSSNENVVTIENGLIKAKGIGIAVITIVSSNGKNDTCTVKVLDDENIDYESSDKELSYDTVESINFSQNEIIINQGSNYLLDYVIKPSSASTKIIWNSSNSKVVSIVGDGLLIANNEGEAIITANTLNGKNASIKVIVNKVNILASSIELNRVDSNILVGEKIQLFANIYPSNATSKKINWNSSDSSIAIVSSNGLVTTKKTGNVVISASTVNGKVANINLKVVNKSVEVSKVDLNNTNIDINVGDYFQLIGFFSPSNATNTKVTWSSSDNNIVDVDNNGLVFAKKAGTAVITIKTSNNKTAVCKVNVNKKVIDVNGISLSKTNAVMNINDKLELNAIVLPTNATNKSVNWISDNTSVAIVDKNGVVTAKKGGVAKITATTSNGKKATAVINVIQNVKSITIDISNVKLMTGESYNIKYNISPTNATDKTVKITSSNSNVIKVENNSSVIAKSVGNATVTITTNDGGFSSKINFVVKNNTSMFQQGNFLKTSGIKIIESKTNKAITLKGFNLGVYLSRSLAFMPIEPIATSKEDLNSKGYSCINSVSFIQALENNNNIIKKANDSGRSAQLIAQDLSNILYDNYITEEDYDLISQSGANVIRLPFEYGLFLYENPKNGLYSFSEIRANESFKRIDEVISECKKRGIYVILDFHLAPGRQNSGGWCDNYTFFENTNYQNAVINMWLKIAQKYKDEVAVAGYDLINEPQTQSNKLISFYNQVYEKIRSVDSNHIIFMEETCVLCGYDGAGQPHGEYQIGNLPNPIEKGWNNVVYSTHDYLYQTVSTNPDDNKDNLRIDVNVLKTRIKQKTDKTISKMKAFNIPYYIGEFSHLGMAVSKNDSGYFGNYLSVWEWAMNYYDSNLLSYTPWTYKGNNDRYFGLVYYGSTISKVNLETSTYEQLKSTFSKTSSQSMKFNKEYYQMFSKQWCK